MVERNGKFGAFHVCKDHGTISIQGGQVVCKGAIFEAVKKQINQLSVKASSAVQYNGEKPTDLELAVRTQVAALGLYMDDLDLFVEGGPNAADYEPIHWMNLRPY